MFFISQGKIARINDNGQVAKILKQGQYFGEEGVYLNYVYSCSFQAQTFCIIVILKQSVLEAMLQDFQDIKTKFQEQC